MDALLILGGLLLMVAGYIWVIVLAFGTGLLWGYGSLFPPVALAYIGVHWRTARKGVGLAALGCIRWWSAWRCWPVTTLRDWRRSSACAG